MKEKLKSMEEGHVRPHQPIRDSNGILSARRDSADSGSGAAELSYLEIKRLVLSIAV